jgi:two-component system, cell cycle response regulator
MRIVLVDPSRTVLKFVSCLLKARGDQVFRFTDGRAALAYIEHDPLVDALVTNTQPLSISGLDLCRETRRIAGEKRSLYIVLMSSNQERHNLIEALDSGADDFIGKPPAAEELYARLRVAERLATMHRELVRLASVDPLTGLFNRRVFFERADAALAQREEQGTLAAIMLDIDYFKRVNDTYGHAVGDRAIREVANVVAGTGEIAGRLGGEEFAMLLPGRDLAAGKTIADRLRQEIMTLRVPGAGEDVTITASFGISQWLAGEDMYETLGRADLALYLGKAAGRNRVVTTDDAIPLQHLRGNRIKLAQLRDTLAA